MRKDLSKIYYSGRLAATLLYLPRLLIRTFEDFRIYIVPRYIANDARFLRAEYKRKLGRYPDLKNPLGFNEKMQWRKLYDRKPLYTLCVDKYRVRDMVQDKVGSQHLIPLLQVVYDPKHINFDTLPEKFVIKVNHGSGQNILVKDKTALNQLETIKMLKYWMRRNHYFVGREWQYKNIKPVIIIEKLLEDDFGNSPVDYKFHCFNNKEGEKMLIQVDLDRFRGHKRNFYDTEWKLQPFILEYPNYEEEVPEPNRLRTMLSLVRKLSRGFDYIRVDLYNHGDEIYFGELTFHPESGFGNFDPPEFDTILGKMVAPFG